MTAKQIVKSATTGSARGERLWLVDFIRQLSISLVFACHLYQSNLTVYPKLVGGNVWVVSDGDIGVWMFFLVSGFVIARTTARRDGSILQVQTHNFYLSRAARLLPLFFVAVVVGIVCSKMPQLRANPTYHDVFGWGGRNWLFWVALFTATFNWLRVALDQWYGVHWDVYWSLAIEEQFYAIFPWTLKTDFVKRNLILVLLSFLVIAPMGRFYFDHYMTGMFRGMNSFCALDLMGLGILLHLFLDKFGTHISRRQVLCHIFAVIGLLCVVSVVLSDRSGAFAVYGPSVLGIGLFTLFASGLNIPWVQRLPRALVIGGELSYGAYVLHPIILFSVWPLLIGKPFALAYLIYSPIVMAVAWLSFNYFERPISSALKRRFAKKVQVNQSQVKLPEPVGLASR